MRAGFSYPPLPGGGTITDLSGFLVYQDLASEKVRRRAYVRLVTNIDMPHGL